MEVFPLPLGIHPRVRKTIGRVAAMTCVAAFATTGTALAACPSPSVSTPFSQFGDTNTYFLVPGGNFDGSAGGWNLNNASVTPGGDPANISGASNQDALTINAGGSAQSPFFCGDNTMPSLRFFANEVTKGSDLRVYAVVNWGSWTGTYPISDLVDGSLGSGWSPGSPISVNNSLAPGQTIQVALKFSVPQWSGAWQIDDVFVDPFRMG